MFRTFALMTLRPKPDSPLLTKSESHFALNHRTLWMKWATFIHRSRTIIHFTTYKIITYGLNNLYKPLPLLNNLKHTF